MDDTPKLEIIMDMITGLAMLVLFSGVLWHLFKKGKPVFIIYLAALFLMEVLSFFGKSNLYLFSISYFIHHLCLSCFFLILVMRQKTRVFWTLNLLLLVPMLSHMVFRKDVISYESYDRLCYNLSILGQALYVLWKFYDRKIVLNHAGLRVVLASLAFFALDFSLALSTNYLLNKPLYIVGWVWGFRALCLLVFYITLITYPSWKTGQNT